jgi:hypothetical protein
VFCNNVIQSHADSAERRAQEGKRRERGGRVWGPGDSIFVKSLMKFVNISQHFEMGRYKNDKGITSVNFILLSFKRILKF